MDICEITTKSALVRSRIASVEYVINPYLGCGHGCRYCYAVFMRKYSRHHPSSTWGDFVEVKTNIAEVLREELRRKRKTAAAMLSSVCDPYQPVERRYRLTRECLLLLRDYGWRIDVLTRSPLVLRDLDVIRSCVDISVGLSIPTDDDHVRSVLEPRSPPIGSRVSALRKLHESGVSTWVFIAPALPLDPDRLTNMITPYTDRVLFDPLNYSGQVTPILRRHGWEYVASEEYGRKTRGALGRLLGSKFESCR